MNRSIFKSWTHYFLSICFVVAFLAFTGCNSTTDTDQNTQADNTEDVNAREEIPQTEAIREAPADTMQQDDTTVYDADITETQAVQENPAETANNQQMEPVEGGVTTVRVSYNQWDANNDGILDEREFHKGFYEVWDEDNDNRITEEEFNTATNDFFANYNYNEYGEYDEWDTNMDDELTDVEFQNKMTAILSMPDDNQAAERLMTVWNQDNDSNIERIELQNITVMLDKDNN